MREYKRKYLPHFHTASEPFLRPIVIDGVGLVKAYRNCCCTNITHFPYVSKLGALFNLML